MANLKISQDHLDLLAKRKAAERLTAQVAPVISSGAIAKTEPQPAVDMSGLRQVGRAAMQAASDARDAVLAVREFIEARGAPVPYEFIVERDERGLIKKLIASPVLPEILED